MKNNNLSKTKINSFQKKVYAEAIKNVRNMPWRKNIDPYSIFISEIMLQQTQVDRVIKKFNQFIKKFPTIKHLAKASKKDILSIWNGLGYNRRALWLHSAANIIVEEHKGKVPSSVKSLTKLPGVGVNTAGAIVAYAYNKPVVFIETNIRSIYIHEFFNRKTNINDTLLIPLIKETLDKKNPRKWYWALMDYGSNLKKIYKNPSRKSKHYAKQTSFEGSNRQLRGIIIKYLLKHKKATIQDIVYTYNVKKKLVTQNIVELEKEGFILHDGETLTLT